MKKQRNVWFYSGMLGGLATITFTFFILMSDVLERHSAQLNSDFSKVELMLRETIEQYVYGLQGAKGVVTVLNFNVSPETFRLYALSRDFFRNFPGALGFGFIRSISRADFGKYQFNNRHLFSVHPEIDTDQHMVIERIEPIETNRAALGLDISFEGNRREAAIISARTGKPTLTKRVALVQQERKHSGFLFFLPVYRTPVPPESEAERMHELVGWAYTPMVLDQLMNDVNAKLPQDLQVEILTGPQDPPIKVGSSGDSDWFLDSHRSKPFFVGQSEWKLTVALSPLEVTRSMASIGIGYLLSLLAFGLVVRWLSQSFLKRDTVIAEKSGWVDALVRGAGYSIIATDESGKILTFNPKAEELLGYKADEVLGTNSVVAFHEQKEINARAETLTKELNQQVEGFETFVAKARLGFLDENEWNYVSKYGDRRPVKLVVSPIRGIEGTIIGFLGVAEDITKSKQLVAELIASRERALEASRVKSAFIANISHEIRTPLNGIIGMATLLLEAGVDAESSERLRILYNSSNSLLELINDVIDFSRLDSGTVEPTEISFDLGLLVKDVIDLFRPLAQQKSISISYDLMLDESTWFKSDPKLLKQILMKLINNAIKFTEQGGVKVLCKIGETVGAKTKVHFSVEDTGVGISAEGREKLFQPFSQVDESTTRRFGGSGLGLVICQGLCDRLGGGISFKSEVGGGSTFDFFIMAESVKAAPAVLKDDSSLSVDPTMGKKHPLKILVAEDNKTNQTVILCLLRKLGYDADIATNGQEAVSLVGEARYDLILMDCHMPIMDGFVATKAIIRAYRGRAARPRIVALTASALKEDYDRCMACGMDGFIGKPISLKRLAEVVSETNSNIHCGEQVNLSV